MEERQPERRDNILIFYFPLPADLHCTEGNCSWTTAGTTDSARKQSVCRHLKEKHAFDIEIANRRNICIRCGNDMLKRVTQHVCPNEGIEVLQNVVVHRHACHYPDCSSTFPTGKGLSNHLKIHRQNDAEREQRREAERDVVRPAEVGQPHALLIEQPRNIQVLQEPEVILVDDDIQDIFEDAVDNINVEVVNNDNLSQQQQHGSQEAREYAVVNNANLSIVNSQQRQQHANQTTGENVIDDNEATNNNSASQQQQQVSQEDAHNNEEQRNNQPDDNEMEQEVEHNLRILRNLLDAENEISDEETDNGTQDSIQATPEDNEPAAQEEVNEEESAENTPAEEQILEEFITPLNEQLRNTNFDDFEVLVADIISKVQEHCKIRRLYPEEQPQVSRTTDPDDCKQIQRLYKNNRRRAVRLILDGETNRCNISNIQVAEHFQNLFQLKEFEEDQLQSLPTPPPNRQEASVEPLSEAEIKRRLAKAENTSPGADGITYRHWKKVDPDCKILHLIYSVCMKAKRIPTVWKKSKTILIPKDGDENDIKNWRPIALCSTIYKIYCSCLVDRLRAWATHEAVYSPAQKGFMPHDGVVEHNFVLQTHLDDARRNNKNLCVALLDLSNAFGSIPIELVTSVLDKYGIGDNMLDIVNDIMTGGRTAVATGNGVTEELSVANGVRQGCPLSGFLFNAGIEPLVRSLVKRGQELEPDLKHHCLAYADDITLLANSEEHLQTLINEAAEKCVSLGLEINPRKCVSLHTSGSMPRGMRDTQFTINNNPIKFLRNFDATKFLGKPIGFSILKDEERLDVAVEKAKKVLSSRLAPWQRIDALKSFILPSLMFPMRTWQNSKTAYKRVDETLRPLIKKTLYLQSRASNEYLYGTASSGSCGIPIAAEDSDIFLIDSAFKLLTSPDINTRELALNDCAMIASHRLNEPASSELIAPYMTQEELPTRSSDHQTLWSKTRSATQRQRVQWFVDGTNVTLRHGNKDISYRERRQVAAIIRNVKRADRDLTLQQKPDQGKTMALVSADKSSSAFMKDGRFVSFADWRFIHKARLNLLPVNGAIRGRPNIDKRCRRCGRHDETLPHVLNHCMRHSNTMQKRHNAIVERLKNTASFMNWEVLSENQTVPGTTDNLRPDLVIKKDDQVLVIDVTCPFENGATAFSTAREEKIAKYTDLARQLKRRYRRVTVEPFIVGTLGAYDPHNASLTKKIATRNYTKVLKLLCVTDTIAWSRKQYIEHITGARQY